MPAPPQPRDLRLKQQLRQVSPQPPATVGSLGRRPRGRDRDKGRPRETGGRRGQGASGNEGGHLGGNIDQGTLGLGSQKHPAVPD